MLTEHIYDALERFGKDGNSLTIKLIHTLVPQSLGQSGKDLEPCRTLFNDAMYIVLSAYEQSKARELNTKWKIAHGYLEGR